MIRPRLALLLLCLAPWTASAGPDAAPVFTTSIAIDPASHTATGGLYANTSIKNVSPVDQEITIWTQEGWSWRSSDPGITPGIEALKNAPAPFVLHPGQEYSGKVELNRTNTKPVTFRLGFYPKAVKPISTDPNAPGDDELIWSNYATAPAK